MSSSGVSRTEQSANCFNRMAPSKVAAYGFAITIIISLAGLAVGGIGLAGHLQAGVFLSLGQINGMIMMVVGPAGGLIASVIGGKSAVAHYRKNPTCFSSPALKNISPTAKGVSTAEEVLVEQKAEPVYGVGAWNALGIVILDTKIPPPPKVDWDATDPYFSAPFRDNYVLLYMPNYVQIQKSKERLTIDTFAKISCVVVEDALKYRGSVESRSGWVLISKTGLKQEIPRDRCENQRVVTVQGFVKGPHILEGAALHLMLRMHQPLEGNLMEYTHDDKPIMIRTSSSSSQKLHVELPYDPENPFNSTEEPPLCYVTYVERFSN